MIATSRVWRNPLRLALWTALSVSALAIGIRAIAGPYRVGVSVTSPMNAEGFFGVSAVLLLLLAAKDNLLSCDRKAAVVSTWQVAAILTLAALAAYAHTFNNPFLADDYDHIPNAIHSTPATLLAQFTHPAADRFFRPAVFAAYAIESRVAGLNRVRWHAISLALHIGVSLLVYAFARARKFNSLAAVAAALLFLVHGARPEAVTWIAAQFDLWAALFVLLALLAFSRGQYALSLVPLLLGLLSKESAYVYPLILLLILRIDRVPLSRWLRLAGPSFALTAVVFLYRWRLLGGIGGYRNIGTDRPYILTFDLLRTGKALTARLAAGLDFPINWIHPLEWWLILTLLSAMGAWAALATVSPDRKKLNLALGFLLLAALPVHEFLLIDSDLEKSRVLYLPSIGYALLFAAALEAARPRVVLLAGCAILAFQTAALEHNLKIWTSVSHLAEGTCQTVASYSGPAALSDISNTIDGVYFLHTGLRNCIEQSAGKSRPDLYLATEPPPDNPAAQKLDWNGATHAYRRR